MLTAGPSLHFLPELLVLDRKKGDCAAMLEALMQLWLMAERRAKFEKCNHRIHKRTNTSKFKGRILRMKSEIQFSES